MTDISAILRSHDAELNGHFKLSSGLHSDTYLQCAQVLQHPRVAAQLGSLIADAVADLSVDVVVGPAIGGLIIGHETARALGVRAVFCERKDGEMQFRRGFGFKAGERALIVEDVITTGKSPKEAIAATIEAGATVVGVSSIVDRSGGDAEFEVPFRPLQKISVATYTADDCPLCASGEPLTAPGSRFLR